MQSLSQGQRYERELSNHDLHLVVGSLAKRQQTFVLGLAAALPSVSELICSIAEFGRGNSTVGRRSSASAIVRVLSGSIVSLVREPDGAEIPTSGGHRRPSAAER